MQPDRTLAFDRRLTAGLIAAALLATATLGDSYLLRLLAIAGCYAILAIGYQRIFGELGVLSLAQGAFFAIGGYVTAIFTGWDGLILLPAAIMTAGLAALIVAPPLLKLASHYFALASLAVAQLVLLAAVNLESLTGGANGLSQLVPLHFAGIEVVQGRKLTLAIWLIVALCAAAFFAPGALAMLRRHVLREAPLAAQALGLNAARWRLASFVFAAACGGLAGGLYAQASGVVAPDMAELAVMINVLAMTVIGGRGRVAGAVIGALILAFLPEGLRFLGGWQLFAWGAAMLAILILAPGGIVGILERMATFSPRSTAAADMPIEPASILPATLRAEGLRKAFGGVVAVDGVSFDLRPGEIVGLVGANGAGKTTLLNLLSGFERADSGEILWRDVPIGRLPVHSRARLGIGRSFQIDQLPGDLTALDAIAVGVGDSGDLADARNRATAILKSLAIDEYAAQPLAALSPAIRRLVDIARALAARPSLLLLDEPTSGLTAEERKNLADVLRDLRARGLSLLLVEHDLAFVRGLADRIVRLDRGRIVEGS